MQRPTLTKIMDEDKKVLSGLEESLNAKEGDVIEAMMDRLNSVR